MTQVKACPGPASKRTFNISSAPSSSPLLPPVPSQNHRLLWILPLSQAKPCFGKPNVTSHTKAGEQEQLPHSFTSRVLELQTAALTQNVSEECWESVPTQIPLSTKVWSSTWTGFVLFLPLAVILPIILAIYQKPENIHNLELEWGQLRILLCIKMNNELIV